MSQTPFHIALVFLLTRKCNLKCTYCNVDAGPDAKGPTLGLRQVEEWVEAVCGLGSAMISVQLHGGEPLMMDPPVELYAAVIRNAVARHPGAQVVSIGLQTNGLLLDEERLTRLRQAGVSVGVSMDGAAASHDRFRITAGGKPSHHLALKAVHQLQAQGLRDEVIAVISEPDDILPGMEFFFQEGLSGARMNPIRAEGRAMMLPSQKAAWVERMAAVYMGMADRIVERNRSGDHKGFREGNLAMLAHCASGAQEESSGCCLLIDESGDLWAHPSGQGKPEMMLVSGASEAKLEMLKSALGASDPESAASDLVQSRTDRLKVCAGCVTPDFCRAYGGHANDFEARTDPLCAWRKKVVDGLRQRMEADPEFQDDLCAVKNYRAEAAALAASTPRASAELSAAPATATAATPTEAIHPMVRKILDQVEERSGRYSVANYLNIVTEFQAQAKKQSIDPMVYRQLAALASQLKRAKALDAANALSALALMKID